MFYRNGETLIRVSKSFLNGFTKRLQHTQPEKREPFYKRWFQNIMIYGMEGQAAAYRPKIVTRYYRVDKIDSSKWNIIYHDFIATRIAVIGLISISSVGAFIAFCSADFYLHGELTSPSGMKLQRDFEELGSFAYVIASAMCLCAFCLIRLHLLRILRIYQSKSNPEDFCMIRAGFLRFYKKTPFNRSQVKVLPVMYEQNAQYYKLFTFGNINISKKSAIINTESFEQPVIKSYMFGERNTLPEKLLSSSNGKSSTAAAKPKKLPPPPMF
jgi:hypothetical protein